VRYANKYGHAPPAEIFLTSEQIIRLQNDGVSHTVLNAMINTARKPSVQAGVVVIRPTSPAI
jgi:hypothetical protein